MPVPGATVNAGGLRLRLAGPPPGLKLTPGPAVAAAARRRAAACLGSLRLAAQPEAGPGAGEPLSTAGAA